MARVGAQTPILTLAGGVTGHFSDSGCLRTPSPTAEPAGAGAACDRCGVAADTSSVASALEAGRPHEGAQGQLLSDGLGRNPCLPLPGFGRSLVTPGVPWLSTALRHRRLCLHVPPSPHIASSTRLIPLQKVCRLLPCGQRFLRDGGRVSHLRPALDRGPMGSPQLSAEPEGAVRRRTRPAEQPCGAPAGSRGWAQAPGPMSLLLRRRSQCVGAGETHRQQSEASPVREKD